MTDEVGLFDQELVVQIFQKCVFMCDMKSGQIAWWPHQAMSPPARVPPLTQFKSIHVLKEHTAAIVACAISPDGGRAVSVGADSQLCEWDLGEGKLIRKFSIPSSAAVAYLADGKSVLLGTKTQSAAIVDLEKQQRTRSLPGHEGNVCAVCVTRGGKYGYTAGDDGVIFVWDLETGLLAERISKHRSAVLSLALMPNGEFLVSTDTNKQVYLWDAKRFIGRLGGKTVLEGDIRAITFNELSDSLILGIGDANAGGVSYRRLEINNEPATVVVKPKGEKKAADR